MAVTDPQYLDSGAVELNASDIQSTRTAFHQRRSFKAVVLLLAYIGAYSMLSVNGQYFGRPSGERRWGFGMAITDLSLWCPAGMHWERRKSISGDYIYDADLLGWFYLPLILADRKWVHPTGHYFDSEDE